ncbi:uncharacterized protein N7484_003107 [Penicillium longicatenatum]|uniref:uncharacterized protein n=1 Tax=Penicillium longicatenatum TaxID=1561947 RepID=UPI0025482A02|nr:uncharacterized protein N7484_003107 [Penicillium longicatenatum]KAJ5649384.1 hypothetical protein N7484_003107 [Penicillium longicatenatum]
MEPQITKNTFCTYTGAQSESDTTVFFVSGNPGLIGYYHPFLSLLAQNLVDESQPQIETKNTTKKTSFQIYGCSLGGFEIPPVAKHESVQNAKEGHNKNHLYDLEGQIRFVHRKLVDLMHGNKRISADDAGEPKLGSDPSTPAPKQKVILIGHSVGAYIAMEILRRHREGIPNIEALSSTGSATGHADSSSSSSFDIIGGVMLFPTVKDIAHSPSGQKLTTLLSFLPHLALIVSFFARILTSVLPSSTLKSVVRSVMKDPPAHGLETTLAFLKSSGGVRQALHMAAHEMRTITSDKWTDDVWGVGCGPEPTTRLFFYFGKNDHWVAEKTRDEVIALRGREEGLGPKMFVCEEGLPHAFCLKHSDIMARKVANMIQGIVQD